MAASPAINAPVPPTSRAASIFRAPPPPAPGVDAATVKDIHERVTWGVIKAVVGATFPHAVQVDREVQVSDGKGGKKARKFTAQETNFRTVRSIHAYPHTPHHWVCLSCGETEDSAEGLTDLHHAKFAGPKGMKSAQERHVICAEADEEVEVHDVGSDGKPVVRMERALLSDREPGK